MAKNLSSCRRRSTVVAVALGLVVGASPRAFADDPSDEPTAGSEPDDDESWGAFQPGRGFLVGRSTLGELSISAYALIRYLDQRPVEQTFVDHLGRERPVDTRRDLSAHRVMVHFHGWIGLPKLAYAITLWTVASTDQQAVIAVLNYEFHRAFKLGAGMNALPGTRTNQGSHPYWLGHDRVMADEFFRPYFTYGVWAVGEVRPGLWYQAMIGKSLSALGITAAQLSRRFAVAGSIWWQPTTHEFGPNGGFGDWDHHDELATRFGVSATHSREDQFSDDVSSLPDNTTIRLADSVNLFAAESLAAGVQVEQARYRMISADAGLKYRGVFLQGHYFQRWLDDFVADGPLPVESIVDRGFYLQAAFFPIRRKLELYGVTSWIFGDADAGFDTQYEVTGGANYYLSSTRDVRLNGQIIGVDRSPVSSSFGYYVGGQRGVTTSLELSVNF